MGSPLPLFPPLLRKDEDVTEAGDKLFQPRISEWGKIVFSSWYLCETKLFLMTVILGNTLK